MFGLRVLHIVLKSHKIVSCAHIWCSRCVLNVLNGNKIQNRPVNQAFKPGARVVLAKFNAYKRRLRAVRARALSYSQEFLST